MSLGGSIKFNPHHSELVATMRNIDRSLLSNETQIERLDMNDEDSVKACAAHFGSLVGNTRFKLNDAYRVP